MLPNLLGDGELRAMEAWLLEQNVLAPGGRPVPVSQLPSDTRTAAYSLATVLNCPGVVSLVSNPDILRLAMAYLGCPPTLSSIGIRWSFPASGPAADTQLFHRDPDDWRFFKLFVYLTDVDENSGPHTYIEGSHVTAGRLFSRSYSMEEIERRFGRDRVHIITGPRGTTFVADTYGIHKGPLPTGRPRLILQVQYSILPVYAFAYAPVAGVGGSISAKKYLLRLLVA